MKFTADRDVLGSALATAARAIVSRSGSLPVLSGVHLSLVGDMLTVTGTDLELSIQVTETVNGVTDGVTCLPARLIVDVVKSSKAGPVTVDVVKGEAHISSGRSSSTVVALNADDFPRIAPPELSAVSVSGTMLRAALDRVVFAASVDTTRTVITGVLFEVEGDGLRVVATDSYRLAVADVAVSGVLDSDRKVIVPARALAELSKLILGADDVAVDFGERQASFAVGRTSIVTRLIEGEYPAYRRIIPEGQPCRLVVSRDEMLDAIKRVKLFARDSVPIVLTMSNDGELVLSAASSDVGLASESLDVEYAGPKMTIAFNPEFLAAGVGLVTGDSVVVTITDALKPALIRSVGVDGCTYLLMPTKVAG